MGHHMRIDSQILYRRLYGQWPETILQVRAYRGPRSAGALSCVRNRTQWRLCAGRTQTLVPHREPFSRATPRSTASRGRGDSQAVVETSPQTGKQIMPRAEQPLGGQTALFLVKPRPPSQVRDDDVEFAPHCPELLLTAHHACQVPDPSPGHYNDGDSSRFIGIEQNADVIANLYVGGVYCYFGF